MKIVIADDHDLVRDALSILLERDNPEWQIIQASNFDEAFQHATRNGDINIALLDIHMPGMNGINSISRLIDSFPKTKVVLMSGIENQSQIAKGYELGASGFVSKTIAGNGLSSIIKLVDSGIKYVPESFLGMKDDDQKSAQALSNREQETLQRLSEGLSNKIIARKMGVEETTIKLHLRSIFKKLDVANRTEAVIKAQKLDLI